LPDGRFVLHLRKQRNRVHWVLHNGPMRRWIWELSQEQPPNRFVLRRQLRRNPCPAMRWGLWLVGALVHVPENPTTISRLLYHQPMCSGVVPIRRLGSRELEFERHVQSRFHDHGSRSHRSSIDPDAHPVKRPSCSQSCSVVDGIHRGHRRWRRVALVGNCGIYHLQMRMVQEEKGEEGLV
jgi:hypothetical protein